ncbi:MAG: SagB/ThcOx family dehydrogenase [Pseudonocardiaceae bacterium]
MSEHPDELDQILRAFDPAQRSRIANFLHRSASRALVLATTPMGRVHAIHNWLNAHGLPPGESDQQAPEGSKGNSLMLPDPGALPTLSLQHALERRRSHYRYLNHPLPVTLLAALLHHALRIAPRERQGADVALPLSRAPSAGGLNPITVHVATRNVDGLSAGVYSYDRAGHALARIRKGDPTGALTTVYGQTEFADRAPVTLLLTAAVHVPMGRYGVRHYRTLHIDAGIVAQNLYLVSTALGLGGCAVTGYRDTTASRLLGFEENDIVMMLFPVGEPCGARQLDAVR